MQKTDVFGRIIFLPPSDAVNSRVILPCGNIEDVPVFTRQPVKFSYDYHGYETVEINGDPILEARYTPRTAGLYEFRACDSDGNIVFCTPFEAEEKGLLGYVVCSEEDPRYFALSCGGGYLPIGLNMVGSSCLKEKALC